MDDNMMERQIADYMVKYGTENTNYGMWSFEVDELTEKFGVTKQWVQEHSDGILSELYLRQEVEDVERQFGGSDFHLENIFIWYFTDFCPNYIEDEQEKDDGVDQYWFAPKCWCTDDVIEAAKRNGIVLTPQQAEQWWQKNEKWFKDTLTEYGNEILFNANFSEV